MTARILRIVCAAVVACTISTSASAAPIMAELVGLGQQVDLDAYIQQNLFGPRGGRLLAQVLCVDLPDCGTLNYIDGAIEADLFDVTVDPGAKTGTWSFDGLTTHINSSVSLDWFVRFIVIEQNFGTHIHHAVFALTEPGQPGLVNLFAGGPIAWTVPNQFVIGTAGLIFYGNANRIPEPSLLALLALGVAPLLARARRRR